MKPYFLYLWYFLHLFDQIIVAPRYEVIPCVCNCTWLYTPISGCVWYSYVFIFHLWRIYLNIWLFLRILVINAPYVSCKQSDIWFLGDWATVMPSLKSISLWLYLLSVTISNINKQTDRRWESVVYVVGKK